MLHNGGNPNVWLSNNHSANNVLQFGQRGRCFGCTDGSRSLFDADVVYRGLEEGVPGGPGYGIPTVRTVPLSNAAQRLNHAGATPPALRSGPV